jgi:hypothetical protein
LRPAAAAVAAPAQPQRYLTNDEAADYLRLSPRTLEKQRVIGGGPKFASSAAASCTPWRPRCLGRCAQLEATSDPEYAEHHAGDTVTR